MKWDREWYDSLQEHCWIFPEDDGTVASREELHRAYPTAQSLRQEAQRRQRQNRLLLLGVGVVALCLIAGWIVVLNSIP